MTLANEIFLGGGNSKVLLAIISNYKKWYQLLPIVDQMYLISTQMKNKIY